MNEPLRGHAKGTVAPATTVDRDQLSRVTIANSFANLVRAASGSFENIVLPVVLIAVLSRADYSNWALVFSIAAYITYLDFGLQTATQALVARSLAARDEFSAAQAARAGLRVYFTVAGCALLVAAMTARTLPVLFPDIPNGTVDEASLTLLVLAAGQAANLGVNVVAGYYAGAHRSHVTAYSIAIARCVSLALSVWGACAGQTLPVIALGYSCPLALTFVAVLVKVLRETRLARTGDERQRARERITARSLLRYSGPLVLWNVCSIFVGAAGTAIVGRVDYAAVAYFSIAMMLTIAVTGIDNALLQPFLTNIGRSIASDSETRASAVLSALRLNSGLLLLLITIGMGAYVVMGRQGLVSDSVTSLLTTALVVAATGVRLAMTPFNMAFLSSNDHRRIIAQPIIEAAVAVGAGLALGAVFGALGVAYASFASALIAVAMLLLWSLRSSVWHRDLKANQALRALAPAAACTVLVLALDIAIALVEITSTMTILIQAALIVGACLIALRAAPAHAQAVLLKMLSRPLDLLHRKHKDGS